MRLGATILLCVLSLNACVSSSSGGRVGGGGGGGLVEMNGYYLERRQLDQDLAVVGPRAQRALVCEPHKLRFFARGVQYQDSTRLSALEVRGCGKWIKFVEFGFPYAPSKWTATGNGDGVPRW